MNLYQKINEVRKIVKTLSKDAATSGYGAYQYTSGSQILAMIKPKMEELGLLFMPVTTEHRGWQTYNYKTAAGKEMTDFVVDGIITYEWINADDPTERMRVEWQYYGQQNDISKAFGSALTYAERYLLLKSLGAPTDEDDPDKQTYDKPANAPYRGGATVRKPKTSGDSGGASKYKMIMDVAESAGKDLKTVTTWIKNKTGEDIKVNDLPDDIFNELLKRLQSLVPQGGE